MEPISVILASFLGLLSSFGIVSDRLAESQIRKQLVKAESLQVRIDNPPTYQVLNGKVNKVRIAGRGLYLTPDLRIDKLELETDPIALAGLQAKLESPIQGAFRLILTEADINRALTSPQFTDRFENIGSGHRRYKILTPQIRLLPNQQVHIQAEVTEARNPEKLTIEVQAELQSLAGKILHLENPTFLLNHKPVKPIVLRRLLPSGIPSYDLSQLEAQNITARILHLKIQPNGQIEIIGFLQIRPPSPKP